MDNTSHLSKVQEAFIKQMNKQTTTWFYGSQRCNCLYPSYLCTKAYTHIPSILALPPKESHSVLCSASYSLYPSTYKSGPFLQPHRGQLAGGPLYFEEIDVVTALSIILEALLVLWGEGGRTQLRG